MPVLLGPDGITPRAGELLDDTGDGSFFKKEHHRRYGQVENIPRAVYFFAHDDIIPGPRLLEPLN